MNMRKLVITLAVATGFSLVSLATLAQSSTMADGEVVKIDRSAGKITIKHGPIKKLAMDEGMTMVFRAEDPALLKQVKAGDKIKFDAENVNGQYTVTNIEKKK